MNLNSYERMLKFVPVFFQDVFEMNAIYKVDGEMIDELLVHIDVIKANRYISSADEKTISEMEMFFLVDSDKNSTLDDRRKLLVSYLIGFGKVSAKTLKSIIKALSNAESEITFLPADIEGNNRLNINFFNPTESYRLDSVVKVLSKRIPGHIWYNIRIHHEKTATIYTGIAVQNGANIEMNVAGINPEEYNILVDENNALLVDEDGRILLD